MRPADILSYGIRRITQLWYFSRSPLAGSDLRVRKRPADAELDSDVDSAISISVQEWTVFHDTCFVEFEVAPRKNGPIPQNAQLVFSSCSIEVPLPRSGSTRVAVPMPATHLGERVGLAVQLSDGRTVVEWQPGARAMAGDSAALLFAHFGEELRARPAGNVLEIGSRARSGSVYRDIVPPGWTYIGMDVRDGPNVDIIADAHDITRSFGNRRFDAVFSVSVFEHLLMPWKAVVEINHVLHPGGLVFCATHQSFPIHDPPWDFWRFSDGAWAGLFNAVTGFEVLDTKMGQPASVVPQFVNDATWGTRNGTAFLVSCVLARKTHDATVTWPADVDSLLPHTYPH